MEMEMQLATKGFVDDGRRGPITEDSPTDELIAWTLERFSDQRLVLTSSFGKEGCALIDMYAAHGRPLTVIYLDTMFFFPETYKLRDRFIERYPNLHLVNRGTTLTPEEQVARHGDELWKRDPDKCCKLRKVDPMYEVMSEVDVWITGLRRSQSVSRANLKMVDWEWRYQALKISPLAMWSKQDVWNRIMQEKVPYNVLHDRGFPSIGCQPCTRPVAAGDDERAGRWSGTAKTECGLHTAGD